MATLMENAQAIANGYNEWRKVIDRTATEVNVPKGITEVRQYAMAYLDNLETLNLNEEVTYIGSYAFYYCSNLTKVTFGGNNLRQILPFAFSCCTNLQTITLPSGLTSLSNRVFEGCSSLISITIPNRVIYLGDYCFMNCRSLTTLYLPNSLSSAGIGHTFNGCCNLEFVTLENGFNCDNLNLSSSTLYSAETIVSWLNALADRTGDTAYTLTVGSTNLAKLTSEQIAIATNKNWNLA